MSELDEFPEDIEHNEKRFQRFLQKAISRHGDKYNYSRVKYSNSKTKVEIVCPAHGSFWILPAAHVYGIGCKKCGVARRAKGRSLSKDEVILRANAVHPSGKYLYDNWRDSSTVGKERSFSLITMFLAFTLAELYNEPSLVDTFAALISALLGPNPSIF